MDYKPPLVHIQPQLLTLQQHLVDVLHPLPDVILEPELSVLLGKVGPGVLKALDLVGLGREALDEEFLAPDLLGHSEGAGEGPEAGQEQGPPGGQPEEVCMSSVLIVMVYSTGVNTSIYAMQQRRTEIMINSTTSFSNLAKSPSRLAMAMLL